MIRNLPKLFLRSCLSLFLGAPKAADAVGRPRMGAQGVTAGLVGLLLVNALSAHGNAQQAQVYFHGFQQSSISISNPSGVAVDTAGNVYVSGNNVVTKIPPGCTGSSCGTPMGAGLSYPNQVAVDAAGDVFGALGFNGHQVIEIPVGCTSAACQLSIGSGLNQPHGVAVDSVGDVIISDTGHQQVVVVPSNCLPSSCQYTLFGAPDPLNIFLPYGLAVDAAFNVYVTDPVKQRVWEYLYSSGNLQTVGGGYHDATGVALDAAGNLFVADGGNNRVLEIPASCLPNSCEFQVGSTVTEAEGLAFDGAGNLLATSSSGNVPVFGLQSAALGTVNVGSNTTVSLTFTVLGGTTVGSISIVTGGVANLDFQDAGSSTCTAQTYASTTDCKINVKFGPTAPGIRAGELIIADASGNTLYRLPLQGTGAGALAVVESGAQTLVTPSSLSYPMFGGTVSDQSGNLYAAFSSQNQILVITPGGTSSVLSLGSATPDPQQPAISSTLNSPSTVAIDNAGSLYIADTGNNRVVVRQPVPGSVTGQYYLYKLDLGSLSLSAPNGVATDASGNVYIMDNGNSRVIKVLPSGAASVLPHVNIGNLPVTGFATDGAGSLYLTGNGEVVKFQAGSWKPSVLYTGYPSAAAVDAAGDVYIADYNVRAGLVEIPVGGTAQTVTLGSPAGIEAPSGISIDSAGNFYLIYGGVYKVGWNAASLNFVTTAVNHTSADSPRAVQLENAGNMPLTVTSIGYPTDFPMDTSDASACTNGPSLAPGAVCDISVQFTPLTAATLSESVTVVTDCSERQPHHRRNRHRQRRQPEPDRHAREPFATVCAYLLRNLSDRAWFLRKLEFVVAGYCPRYQRTDEL
jgi:sugar lactone lactonase YvrE